MSHLCLGAPLVPGCFLPLRDRQIRSHPEDSHHTHTHPRVGVWCSLLLSSNFLHPVAPHLLRLHPRFLRCLHVCDYKNIFSTEWGERVKRRKQISRARGCNPGYKTKRSNPQAREAWEQKRGQGRKHQGRTGRTQGAWALPPWLWQTDLRAVVRPSVLLCALKQG